MSIDAQRAIEQVQRKREYNRAYYHSKIKPRKVEQKLGLEKLKEENTELNLQLELKNKDFDKQIIALQEKIRLLQDENNNLISELEIYKEKNSELMMKMTMNLLPNLDGLRLN